MRIRPYIPAQPPRIAIVGEAPGASEEMQGRPFVGASGQELRRMLAEAGIDYDQCYVTNVFFARPPENKLIKWCASKKDVGGKHYTLPPLQPGKYLKPEHLYDVTEADTQGLFLGPAPDGGWTVISRLKAELRAQRPTLILALGNIACWALLGTSGIKSIRGTVTESSLGIKVLPTFHPAMILRDWSARSVTVFDLMKAERESHFPEIVRPQRTVWIEPTIEDLLRWKYELLKAPSLSIDIETGRQQIKCVGFSPNESSAFVIPFVDQRKPEYSYWPTKNQELLAWNTVRELCGSPIPKRMQNGFYDIQYLWRAGVPTKNFCEDTMIASHAQQPELEKGLGFLGSVHTNEASWKLLRKRSDDQEKADD